MKVILLLYASSTTSADPIRNSGGSHFSGHENLSYRNAPRSIQRRPSHPNSLQHSGPPDPYLNQNRPHLFLRSLVAREAKSKKHSTAPPAKPKATPQQAKVLKVEQKEKTKQKKAQESVAKNEKKAQVQKSKDQKLVNGMDPTCSYDWYCR